MAVVVVAPDSFKGSATAVAAAAAIARGWVTQRPADLVIEMPVADGGEGTLDSFERGVPGAIRHPVRVEGPAPGTADVETGWLELPASAGHPFTAVVELADAGGFTRLAAPAPLTAHTRGLGRVICAALDAGAEQILVALGGSCSTDGGAGVLAELGARVVDRQRNPIGDGGSALAKAVEVDLSAMPAPPPLGIRLLVDVDNPLLGDRGAARIFGPQKGATPADVELLDRGLATWARLLPVDPATAGSGAAGGTAFGLLAWGAHIVPGGRAVADLLGIRAALLDADLVITGEGRFDAQSLGGKAPRIVLDLAAETGTAAFVIAGDTDAAASAWPAVTLTSLAGSTAAAVDDAERWLVRAGAAAAVRYSERGGGEPRPDGVARGEPRRRR